MIRAFSLAEAAGWLGAPPVVSDARFSAVSTDTRTLGPGQLFLALRGENFDGHAFLQTAKEAGAAAAVVDHLVPEVDLPQLVVSDTLRALGQLAAANRNESSARFVAVTGSSGKTTVKEMVAAILSRAGDTLATRGNLNNHIGVPLTLLAVGPEHRFAMIEHGASAVGEIAETIALTRPEVGILTNAAEAHLEGFGGYDNIVEAKGEIIDGVSADGVVVLNHDDPAFDIWLRRAGQRRVVSVSCQHREATFTHTMLATDSDKQCFQIHGPSAWECTINLTLPGAHNVLNALLAVAAAHALGIAVGDIEQGLADLQPVRGRLNPVTIRDGLNLIDDSYNANPSSMKAALGVLAQQSGIRIAMLGAMAELGADSDRLHQDVGKAAKELGIDRLVVVGPGCGGYLKGFGSGGESCDDHAAAVDYLLAQGNEPMTVLLKGSRSSAMDRVVEGLQKKVTDSCCSG